MKRLKDIVIIILLLQWMNLRHFMMKLTQRFIMKI
jgi:hypothetical protein